MKNKTKLLVSFAVMAMLLSSCGHTHSYKWEHNSEEHWQVCECGNTTAHQAHSFTQTVVTEPKCTTDGLERFTCKDCGYSYDRAITQTGHKWDQGTVTKAAKCDAEGEMTFTCTVCKETKKTPIPATCSISLDSEIQLSGFDTIYKVVVTTETDDIATKLAVSDVQLSSKVAVRVDNGGVGNYYQPKVGTKTFNYITDENTATEDDDIYGVWYKSSDLIELDAEGKVAISVGTKSDKKFAVGATIYFAFSTINYKISKTTAKEYQDYEVYDIAVIKDIHSFDAVIDFGPESKDVLASVTVEGLTGWIGVQAGSIPAPVYYRAEWHEGDWWTKMGVWTDYTDSTDANGQVTVHLSEYEVAINAGTHIYVALKEKPAILVTVTKDDTKVVEGFKDVYSLNVVAPTGTFSVSIPYATAGAEILGKVTVECPGSVYFEPQIGSLSGVFWKGGDGWSTPYGEWKDFTATIDADGNLPVTVKDYLGTLFPVGSKVYVAIKVLEPVAVEKTTEKAVPGFSDVYAVRFNKESNTVSKEIAYGNAGDKVIGRVTVECPGDVYFEPQIGSLSGVFWKGNDGWSTPYGTFKSFTATLDENGKLPFTIKDYLGTKFPAGSVVYIAIKAYEDYTVAKDTKQVSGYEDVYSITANANLSSFSTKISWGEAGDKIEGKFTVTGPTVTYINVNVGSSNGVWYKGGDGWSTSYGDWTSFTGTIDANGQLTVEVNDYLDGKIPEGTVIYVCVRDFQGYELKKTTEKKVEGFDDVYEIKLSTDLNTFSLSIPYGEAGQKVYGKVTVECPGDVYFEPQVGSLTGVFWKGNDGWSTPYGEFKDYTATLDENGELPITIKDYADTKFPANSAIYVSIKLDSSELPYTISETTEKTYEDYKVYDIDVTKSTSGFEAKIKCGDANAAMLVAIAVNGLDDWIGIKCGDLCSGQTQFYRKGWQQGDWWAPMDSFLPCNATLDADGNLLVTVESYGGNIPDTAHVFVAVKAAA